MVQNKKNGCKLQAQQKNSIHIFSLAIRFCFLLNLRQAGNSIDLFLIASVKLERWREVATKCKWNEPLSYLFIKLRYLIRIFFCKLQQEEKTHQICILFAISLTFLKFNRASPSLFQFYSSNFRFPGKTMMIIM